MILEPKKLQNRGKQGWPDAGKGTAERLRREAETPEVRQERLQHHRTAERLRREAKTPEARQQRLQHKHIYIQVPACTQGVLTVPPTLCYRKRSTNNVSCSLLRLAPRCPHSLVIQVVNAPTCSIHVTGIVIDCSPYLWLLILGACAAGLQYLVCVSVCLSPH